MALAIALRSTLGARPHAGIAEVPVYFALTPSGNYPGSGGESIDLASAFGTAVSLRGYQPLYVPVIITVSGYVIVYDLANKKFKISQCAGAGNPFAELAAAAYPAGLTSDTQINGVAFFLK